MELRVPVTIALVNQNNTPLPEDLKDRLEEIETGDGFEVETFDPDCLQMELEAMFPEDAEYELTITVLDGFDADGEVTDKELAGINLSDLQELQEGFNEYDAPFVAFFKDDGEVSPRRFEDAYVGKYDSEAEFCEQLADELGYLDSDTPSWITSHVNWQDVWDCELRHDYDSVDNPTGGVYIFNRNY